MDSWLTQLQPYVNVVTAVFSIATLGLVVNVFRLSKEAAAERVKVFEDRLAAAKEDYERTEKWQGRERERLENELKTKQTQLEDLLKNAGLDLSALTFSTDIKAATDGLREQVTSLVEDIRLRLMTLPHLSTETNESRNDTRLTLAKGDLAIGQWDRAATLLDEVARDEATIDWKYHLSRGVAHANARGGFQSDLSALRAYNDAIAFAPLVLEPNKRAKLFTYRGAIEKRLGRFDEALADLLIGQAYATTPYQVQDNLYNLACVYALKREREKMFDSLFQLKAMGYHFRDVRSHQIDYFAEYQNDSDFLTLIYSGDDCHNVGN